MPSAKCNVKLVRLLIYLCLLLLLKSFNFGNDVELFGGKIPGEEINYVSDLTGLTFPDGTEPVENYFFGSEIDRSLAFKVAIPEAKREAFIRNEIFENGNHVKSDKHFTNKQDWRKVDELTERIHRNLGLPNVKFVECTVGRENGKTHVYVSWFEI